MGVIQGSINNLLVTAGIAARLSPDLEKRAALRDLKAKEKVLNKSAEIQQEATGPETNSTEANEVYSNTLQNKVDISQARFDLQPNEQNYRNLLAEKQGKLEFDQIVEQANTKLLERQEQKRRSEQFRRGFLEGVPTNDIMAQQKIVKEGK